MNDTARRGQQLNDVIKELREAGRADAHLLLMRNGISRLAPIIHTLRKEWGADSIETTRQPGEMAVYILKRPPAHWYVARQPRSSGWKCSTCATPAPAGLTLAKRTPTLAIGDCPACEGSRVYRR